MINFVATIQSLTSKTHEKLGKILIEKKLQLATAESCTGGLLSSKLTDVSGSSGYTRANFVTYSNKSKSMILRVKEETLKKYGAVSEQCAYEMAEGLSAQTECDIAICTTGIAGPTGGTEKKPIGLIYISIAYRGKITVKELKLNPKYNRKNMKFMFCEKALQMALDIISPKFEP